MSDEKKKVQNPAPQEELTRNFPLSSLAVNNRTSVLILTVIISLFGLYSYISMPKEQFPEVKLPTIYVNTIYPGNSPVDIENLITRPIEKELKPVKGVKKISSTSAQDVSAVVIEFNEDVNITEALTDVKDAVDKAKAELPTDLDQDPSVMELDFSEVPIVYINLSGDFEINQLKEYAEYLQDEIEELSEVSEAVLSGALEREIQINADLYRMEAMNVTFGNIEQAIAAENISMSGGDILIDGYRRSMRVVGEFTKVEQIENIIVKAEEQRPIYLKDVAEVKDSYKERQSYARLATTKFAEEGSFPVISLMVKKRSGANLIEASEQIDEILEKAQKERLPQTLDVTLTNDQSIYMKRQISNLENSIISGVLLVVIVLLFFMGLRNALLVGLAIPLSMFIAFLVLSSMGVTINMVVLFALILALGMLVDNAIVVIENIYRLLEQGYPMKQAAKEGVGEVAMPIISSTATTLAAFVPLAFWGGIMGEFMKYLPITLIIVLASSLFVGLVINPVVSMVFMKVSSKGKTKKNRTPEHIVAGASFVLAIVGYLTMDTYTMGNLFMSLCLVTLGNVYILTPASHWFQDVLLVKLEEIYLKVLRYALSGARPYLFLGATVLMLFGSIGLVAVSQPQVSLFPENEPQYVYLYIEMPLGTDVETTNAFTEKLEKKVYGLLEPYSDIIESVITNVGENAGDPNADPTGGGGQPTPHKSRISIAFVEFKERGGKSSKDVLRMLSDEMRKVPQAKIKTDKNRDGPPVGKPVNIELTGEDYTVLLQEAEKVKTLIEQSGVEGLDKLEIEAEVGKPELILNIDRDKARKFGLSTSTVAMTLRGALFGKEVSKFKDGDDDHPIQLRLEDKFRYNLPALLNQKITFRDNMGGLHQIPVSAVATVDYSSSFGSVKRKDLDKMVAVSSNIVEGYNANEIVAQIKRLMESKYEAPANYAYRFGGEQEEQAKSMAFLVRALLIAVCAIFLILVSQFDSFTIPFIILGSVVLSTIGVFLGLVIFNMDFIIIMTGIGIISLAGVVVNNAIVLIDYINLTRQRRKEELGLGEDDRLDKKEFIECLVKGGYTRLRPVLLTAITTVLGLVPLATGMNIDFIGLYAAFDPDFYTGGDNALFWGPMAWTVIYGLVFATFLTLVIVPVMYLIEDRIQYRLKKLFA